MGIHEDAISHVEKTDVSGLFPIVTPKVAKVLGVALVTVIITAIIHNMFPQKDVLGWGKQYTKTKEVEKRQKKVARKLLKKIAKMKKDLPKLSLKNKNITLVIKKLEKLAKDMQKNPKKSIKKNQLK